MTGLYVREPADAPADQAAHPLFLLVATASPAEQDQNDAIQAAHHGQDQNISGIHADIAAWSHPKKARIPYRLSTGTFALNDWRTKSYLAEALCGSTDQATAADASAVAEAEIHWS